MRQRARGRRLFAALVDVLMDDEGNLPCPEPDDCRTCALFAPRRPDETSVEHGRRLFAALLRAEHRLATREVMDG